MRPYTIIIILTLSFSIACCTNEPAGKLAEKEITVYVSPFKPLLTVDDHVSEGFLAPLDDGRILLIFRFDPGIRGDHVGTRGYIAKIHYDPIEDEWGEVEPIYNSHRYDDRNVHGGVTKDGKIIVFFRRYDSRETEGRYFIVSKDNGKTWTEPQTSGSWTRPEVSSIGGIWSTGQMFYNPDTGKYNMLGCRRYITYSKDGTSWEKYNLITDNKDYKLTEVAGAWVGDNTLIALIRDDERQHGHPLVQVESHDNGKTWTEPVSTNIPPHKHFGAAPQLFYNKEHNVLIAINSDRYSRADSQNSLFIYTARPDDVIGNPKGWTLHHELLRPWARLGFDDDRPLNFNLYGYPTIAPIDDNEYLVVFTERARMHGTEQADLYYFRMIIK